MLFFPLWLVMLTRGMSFTVTCFVWVVVQEPLLAVTLMVYTLAMERTVSNVVDDVAGAEHLLRYLRS